MTAPIAAGTYHISVSGFQPSKDAVLHADVLHRHGGSDEIIASADSGTVDFDMGLFGPGDISADVAGKAVSYSDGDLLVLRVKMVSGTDGYIELGTSLTLP